DLETNELTDTKFTISAPRNLSFVQLGEPDFPGVSLAAVDTRGTLSYYNLETGNTKRFGSDPAGIPNRLNSLERGPDGNIYIGGYLSPQEGAMYNPVSNEVTKLPGLGQVEGMGAHNGSMYFGIYPGALIWEYDPTKPWSLRANPNELFSLKEDGQDR